MDEYSQTYLYYNKLNGQKYRVSLMLAFNYLANV